MTTAGPASALGPEVIALLPAAIRACLRDARWWRDELAGLHLMTGLDELALPDGLPGYRRIDGAPSRQWPRPGHALVHESSIVHAGVSFFGPVLVGPDCELGPHAAVYGPTVVESGSYLGPSAEIRRSLLLAGAEVSHLSYVGHSVLGRGVRLGAFFCAAVRNLRRGTVHLLRDGVLVDTGQVTIGCVIADGTQTGVHATVMPGRRIVATPVVPANAIVTRNC
jgi:UDP-N-acetylglucosamine diphosphorylase / glucose-1-phosphate thymidylyltransferase / UDP-N-acetylgalactosamine diphosphorylase / glucosamine-1-phosphate N-acetyltransferase / galactosamine-1-phosphate N-acetyltransferase